MRRGVIRPVFADGPWRGRQEDVNRDQLASGLYVVVMQEPVIGPPSQTPGRTSSQVGLEWGQVLYRFTRYAIFGRLIWVGVCGNPESEEALNTLWDLLITDAGKAASEGGYVFWLTTE
jgi:hypothetical protein